LDGSEGVRRKEAEGETNSPMKAKLKKIKQESEGTENTEQ